MENKKVIFIDALDVISIPSKEKEPRDYTDFKLNYRLIEALRKQEGIMRVNILLHMDTYNYSKLEVWKTILDIVGFSISSIACKAVVGYPTYGDGDSFELAVSSTRKADAINDEATWLMVGECVKNNGVDNIGLADFINGAD